ncbi:hypothetical protein [Clostridium magnum]|uniref:Uncharacterized protein n=1 Tax=Clostridium magnum DSM 2767 TaxID=1121326 RepID=A0A162QNL5_9CLOT|nr:hypothetical protein [Clostridium magnum]KZL88667.1 hypothetical protein CLMAG_59560 [Clostridium magnum DSM 2767]KZL88757.1 hypothetical protein CLMAG_60460 [Clostridium magnum DSM 2767]SHJ60353.1 hypothetical protein SAMN02745944_06217 [Clostridium magnum DSM 2767]
MSIDDFKNEVFKIYCQNDITVSQAVEIAKAKFKVSDELFQKWFL